MADEPTIERASTGDDSRTVGLFGATSMGIGAIVGGGILVLAGTAFAYTGPSAIIAFGLNGLVALLTAMSFAEISSAFPYSGGAYTFAKKVLSVRAAFGVGWILWFAYIVAAVLYALGFARFAQEGLIGLWHAFDYDAPDWLMSRRMSLLLATLATLGYALSLVRSSIGGGQWATYGKVVVFIAVVGIGGVALLGDSAGETIDKLDPFFAGGGTGLIMAMGFSFIALQGFDLVAAIAGEVKEPAKTIPKAMFLSLGIALVIYLPLLFLVSTAGTGTGTSITALAADERTRDTVIAIAAKRFIGPIGYWLVVIAALLAMLSALQANLLAASRVALSMARDRTLPGILARRHKTRQTPILAIYASTLAVVAISFMVPNLAAAGAAASLIFLISFSLAHITAFLARRRVGRTPYSSPLFPTVPILGGVACTGLAVFQAFAVPDAGAVVIIWLGLGVLLYLSLFASRAEVADASAEALDPELLRLRGRRPLVLLPVANPENARSLVAVANALAPNEVARVLLLTVVPEPGKHGRALNALDDAQKVVLEGLSLSFSQGNSPEALITSADDPAAEIVRIAEEHGCDSVLLGLGEQAKPGDELYAEGIVRELDCDAAVMRAPSGWRLRNARKILVPVSTRSLGNELRARVLSSICRTADREITFVSVLPKRATDDRVASRLEEIARLSDVKLPGTPRLEVLRHDDASAAILEIAADYDLLVLGLDRMGFKRKAFGRLTLRIATEAPCAAIILSRAPSALGAIQADGEELVSRLFNWRS